MQEASPKQDNQEIKDLQEIIESQAQEINCLKETIYLLKHRQFGRRSEKYTEEQLQLFDDLEVPPETEPEDSCLDEINVPAHRRKKNRALPKDLPKETVHYDLDDNEKICACGCNLQKIGEDIYQQLEYIPASVKVKEHIKSKYACPKCDDSVKTAVMPKQPIPKSIATPGLLAHVIISKYVDHLPLYRQEQMFQRLNIGIKRKTLCNWILKCADLLKPMAMLLKSYILQQPYIRADETTVNVLSNEQKNSSYMWVMMGGVLGSEAVFYKHYSGRTKNHANDFLAGYVGYLQTDGYHGYNDFREQKEVVNLGCWAHARRKFHDVVKASKNKGAAYTAMSFITKLYRVEKDIKTRDLNILQIYQYREQNAQPILNDFKIWLDKTTSRVPPKSALGKAIQYTLNQWPYLIVYIKDGNLDIDNNAIERMIKPFAVGRKNWLFCGNDIGAEASAILYSLVQSCKVNQIDPYQYFRTILTELPNRTTDQSLDQWLPWKINKPL